MKRYIPVIFIVLACVVATVPGCTADTSHPITGTDPVTEQTVTTDVPDEAVDTEKGIHIFVQSEVRDVTVNGISIPVEEDTFIPVQGGEAIVTTYSYPNGLGGMQEAKVTLDSYYRYFVLKNSGRYASSIYEETYQTDKTSD